MKIRALLAALVLISPVLFAAETAQPELPVTPLRIGQTNIRAEVADDDAERASGLMFRESLAPNSRMLFVMPAGWAIIGSDREFQNRSLFPVAEPRQKNHPGVLPYRGAPYWETRAAVQNPDCAPNVRRKCWIIAILW